MLMMIVSALAALGCRPGCGPESVPARGRITPRGEAGGHEVRSGGGRGEAPDVHSVEDMIIQAMFLAGSGACALAVGTHLQHRGVVLAANRDTGPGAAAHPGRAPHLKDCLRTPTWLFGLLMVLVATVMNMVALALAPVALVQPLGVVSLICAALISTRTLGLRMTPGLVLGILACMIGVVGFVTTSAVHAHAALLTDATAWGLAVLLGAAVVTGLVVLKLRAGHLVSVAVSGVLFGLVAVSVHLVLPVIARGLFDIAGPGTATAPSLVVVVVLILLLAGVAGLGSWLVQTAYASGPPETVLAGLTVLDPMIAVLVGATVLGEYGGAGAALVAAMTGSVLLAVAGIVLVVRHHPGLGMPDSAVPHPADPTPGGDGPRAHTTQPARG